MNRQARRDTRLLKLLTYLMFAMFAMTTDSVGVIIPEVIRQFSLGMTVGGAFQYATMSGISLFGAGARLPGRPVRAKMDDHRRAGSVWRGFGPVLHRP